MLLAPDGYEKTSTGGLAVQNNSEDYGMEVEVPSEAVGDPGDMEVNLQNGRGKRRRVESRRYGNEFWKYDLLDDSDDDE